MGRARSRPGERRFHAMWSASRVMGVALLLQLRPIKPLTEWHAAKIGENLPDASVMTRVTNQGRDLLELLWLCHRLQCGDKRDRLFSLYGIARPVKITRRWAIGPRLCPVDYSKNWVTTYTIAAANCAREGGFSDILQHIFSFGSLYCQNPSWPSWVPSWNQQRFTNARLSRQHYDICSPCSPHEDPLGNLTGLCVEGYLHELLTPPINHNYCFLHRVHALYRFTGGTLSILSTWGKTDLQDLDEDTTSGRRMATAILNAIEDKRRLYNPRDRDDESLLNPTFPLREDEKEAKKFLETLRAAVICELEILSGLPEAGEDQELCQRCLARLHEVHEGGEVIGDYVARCNGGKHLPKQANVRCKKFKDPYVSESMLKGFSKDAVRRELERVLGLNALLYFHHPDSSATKGILPCIAPPGAEAGDYIFRPCSWGIRPPAHLLLRPAQNKVSEMPAFRIISMCFPASYDYQEESCNTLNVTEIMIV